ncbi:pupal cuticle protein C1B-like [Lucilia cuprina]|uniref:pupal cuticle protein C1B-like n=1 Tax=Lucilia cuprina TaxID=7375 RepID=UPI001F05B5FA|nr:pupal cuticle protein C1B-like [Lucilia cuprina]
MFKFIAVCFFALLAVVAAKPGLVAPLAYSAPLTYAAAPAVVGHASYVAPYASTYNAHHVAHSAAFSAAYAAAPVVAAHYAAAPVVSAAYAAPLATPFAAPVLLKK